METNSGNQTAAKEDPKRIVLSIGADKVDLTEYPPLKQGEKAKLKAKPYELNMRKMSEWEEEEESRFALFMLIRVRPETTRAEVDELPAKIIQDLAGYCMNASTKVDSPFSKPSTSSPAPTDGAKTT